MDGHAGGQVAVRMRGLALLCLLGFVLTALLSQGSTRAQGTPLRTRPLEGTNGTNAPKLDVEGLAGIIKRNITNTGSQNVQWNGTIRAIESNIGFPPEEDTKVVHHNVSVEATVKDDVL